MRTPTVRLYIRVRDSSGSFTYHAPAFNRNRTLRAGYAIVAGRHEAHPEGVYYLRYVNGKKRIWRSIGRDADAALAALQNKEHDLRAISLGRLKESDSGPETPGTVAEAVATYLDEVRRFRSVKTVASCERILALLRASLSDRQLASLRRNDLLDHIASLVESGLAPRTVYNHVTRVKAFLRSQGITCLLRPEDTPRYDQPEVEAYNATELAALLRAATTEECLLYEFFLFTGFRDQEVQYCTWRNVDFSGKVIAVLSKPELGFRPKDKEERSVPVPDGLIESLERRRRISKSQFIFPASNGGVDAHFLRRLQRLAHNSGLNCGECMNKKMQSCRTHPICSSWGLHKFRKTFATMHHEAGVTATTIQRWLGHSDLSTTLRYLAIADIRSEKTRQQVNATFSGLSGHLRSTTRHGEQ